MKKFYGILFLLALMAFKTNVQAQTPCDAITATVINPNPQGYYNNYFGAKVSLPQPYSQNVTVEGYLFENGNPNNTSGFNLTITAGSLSAQTDDNIFTLDGDKDAGIQITSVTPCPPNGDGYFFYYNINNIEPLTNTTLKNKIIQTFLSGSNNINPDVTYNTDSLKLLTFDYTDIKAVYTEQVNFAHNTSSNRIFMAYTTGNNLVADIATEATVNTDSFGNTIINYLDETGQTVSTLTVSSDGSSVTLTNNPNWSDPYAISMNKVKLVAMSGPNMSLRDYLQMSVNGYWDRFMNCLRTGMTQLSGGGSNAATLGGVAMLAMGKFAAPGALLGCSLHAIFF